jgi:hypothetical protein
MKKLLLVGVIAGGLILGGCSEEPTVKENEPEVTQEVVKEEPVKEPEVVEEEVIEEPEVSPELYLSIMEENFAGIAEVTYDEENNAFVMLPTDPAFTQELEMILAGTKSIDDWNGMVDSLATMSIEFGADYVVVMANPVNPDNYILMVGNGVVLYDALNE